MMPIAADSQSVNSSIFKVATKKITTKVKKKIEIDDAFEKSLAELAATGMILKGK